MIGISKMLASVNIFIASILFGLAFIKPNSLAMPLGLHYMANFMQGTVMGFGVSGEKGISLFNPSSDDCPVWLNGGEFGVEASILGLMMVILITLFFFRSKSTIKKYHEIYKNGLIPEDK